MRHTPEKAAILANAADQAAQMAPKHTTLQSIDHETFFAGLDTPPAPNEKLRAAFAHHRDFIDQYRHLCRKDALCSSLVIRTPVEQTEVLDCGCTR